jgi:hypothetical protein
MPHPTEQDAAGLAGEVMKNLRAGRTLAWIVLFPLWTAAASLLAQRVTNSETINYPEAPSPRTQLGNYAENGGSPAASANGSVAVQRQPVLTYAPKYAKDIDGGLATEPLTVRGKFAVSLLEQLRFYSLAGVVSAAGFEHLRNSNPKYGTDMGGFGERLGAAALLSTSQSILTDGVAASLLHQDPRFYRLGTGGVVHRIIYAATRVVTTRGDSGSAQFNSSQWLGYAGAALLTRTYYPAISNSWSDTAEGYGLSLAGSALGDEVKEFAPSIMRSVFHRNR